MRSSGSSLYRAQAGAQASQQQPARPRTELERVSLFAVPQPEPRVVRKHDLVTIIVREQSEFRSEGSAELKKDAKLQAQIDDFVRFSLSNFALRNAVSGDAPAVGLGGSRTFKGDGGVDRADSLTARVTAEVVDVKPNGNLVLAARKRISTDEEVQTILLTGTCRAVDITADNTVLSTNLYDLVVDKQHEGTVRNATKRGRLPRLMDRIDPW